VWHLVGLLIVILYLVSLVILPVIITQKKRPEAAIAWVMLVIFVPFIGPFVYLVFGIERIKNRKLEKVLLSKAVRGKLRQIEKTDFTRFRLQSPFLTFWDASEALLFRAILCITPADR
jgi:cardiolipin synthase